MVKILETERLILRCWGKSDAPRLLEICRDPEVMKHIGDGRPYKTSEEVEDFLIWAEKHQAENGFCRWAVMEKTGGEIAGSCGFERLPETGEIELGYLFDRKFWGRGFATEAARGCLRHGFSDLGFREIIALTDPDHTASQNVLIKTGFTKRGLEIYDNLITLVYSAKNI
ncbi:MAG: GNAT family N-acetyltransferase [Pyrinomonadaceae bacterium]